jgi:hypothetical protein
MNTLAERISASLVPAASIPSSNALPRVVYRIARRELLALSVLLTGLLGAPIVQAGTSYNAAADFSTSSNPNGVWSYGQESSLSGPLTLFTTVQTSTGNSSGPGTIDILSVSGFNGLAALFYNGSSSTYDGGDPGTGIAPGVLAIEAGNPDYGVTRFTAPTAGLYSIDVSFFGITIDTAHVLVVMDGNPLYSATHSGYGPGNVLTFTEDVSLQQGDTIDFAVGPGPGGNAYDYVGLNATISSVPEPTSIVPLSMGVLSLLAARSRCRRSCG